MYQNEGLSVVIPCRDEESGIRAVLEELPAFIDEVIVVDNGSKDRTAEVAKEGGARVVSESRIGYGSACQKGLVSASKGILVMMDGDWSYSCHDIEKLVSHLLRGKFDFVNGSRFPLADKTSMPFLNQHANAVISWCHRKVFGIQLADSQSGMFALRRNCLSAVLPSNSGMDFSQEIKLNAWLNARLRCSEVPIGYRPRVGKSKFRALRDGLGNLYDLAVHRMGYRSG